VGWRVGLMDSDTADVVWLMVMYIIISSNVVQRVTVIYFVDLRF
jgi:hypothetical protein